MALLLCCILYRISHPDRIIVANHNNRRRDMRCIKSPLFLMHMGGIKNNPAQERPQHIKIHVVILSLFLLNKQNFTISSSVFASEKSMIKEEVSYAIWLLPHI